MAALPLSGAAVLQVVHSSSIVHIALWFLGAVLVHDLVLYPLHAAVDRAAGAVLPGGAVNWLRVPTLLSGLLLLVFWPVVTSHSQGSYRFVSGLSQDVFLARYLAIVATLFLGSGLLFALLRLSHLRRTSARP